MLLFRFFYLSYGTGLMFGLQSSDIIYNTLPLYHTVGGVLGIGQMIQRGCTVVVRSKFSASQYWTDCIKYKATVSIHPSIKRDGYDKLTYYFNGGFLVLVRG